MAHTIQITPLVDGSRNLILHIYLVCDGVSGELDDEVIADPTDYGMPVGPGFTVEGMIYDLTGFSARLTYDYLESDNGIWTMAPDQSNDLTFPQGLADRSAIDGTGKIQLSTTGFTTLNDAGSIILRLRKT